MGALTKCDEVAVLMGKLLLRLGYDATLHPRDDGDWDVRATMKIRDERAMQSQWISRADCAALQLPASEIAERFVQDFARNFVTAAANDEPKKGFSHG